jgi:hypothetical protein
MLSLFRSILQSWDRFKMATLQELFRDADVVVLPVTKTGLPLDGENCSDFEVEFFEICSKKIVTFLKWVGDISNNSSVAAGHSSVGECVLGFPCLCLFAGGFVHP